MVALLTREDEEGGVELVAIDASGTEVEHTWHGGLNVARAWAADPYGTADLGPWREVPDAVMDVGAFVLRQHR